MTGARPYITDLTEIRLQRAFGLAPDSLLTSGFPPRAMERFLEENNLDGELAYSVDLVWEVEDGEFKLYYLGDSDATTQTKEHLVYNREVDSEKARSAREREKEMKVGGLTKGASHEEGGIPMVVKSTGQHVELEGGEGVVNKHSMASEEQYDFEGKKMTTCEIVSHLNQQKGDGVAFSCASVEGEQYGQGGDIQKAEQGGEVFESSSGVVVRKKPIEWVYQKQLEDGSWTPISKDEYDGLL